MTKNPPATPRPASPVSRALNAALPLEAKPGQLVFDCTRNEHRYAVFCGHAPTSSANATVNTLRRKLRKFRQEDEAGEDVTTLTGQSLSDHYASWSAVTDAEDYGDGEYATRMVRFGYQLVVYAGRSPVGYCTFVTCIDEGLPSTAPSIEVEVLEIWVAPPHRGIGVGDALAQSVAQLATAGIFALELRLRADAAPSTVFRLTVAADIHSSSGAHFLRVTAQRVRDELNSFGEMFPEGLRHVLIDQVDVDPRW